MVQCFVNRQFLFFTLSILIVSGCTPTAHNTVSNATSAYNQSTVSSFRQYPQYSQNNVYFDTASSIVKSSEYRVLEIVGSDLSANDRLIIEISGHADERGDSAFNSRLSNRRAEAVARILYDSFGIAPTRMAIVGYGEAFPVSIGTTEAAWAQNRRVQLDVYLRDTTEANRKQFSENQLSEKVIESFENSEDPSEIIPSTHEDSESNSPKHSSAESSIAEPKFEQEKVQNPQGSISDNKPEPTMELPPVLENAPCESEQDCGQKGLGVATGTGFFITSDGWLMTNHHVIADTKGLFVVVDGEMIPAGVEAYSINNDLAILSINLASKPIPFSIVEPKKGSEVAVLGYPNISVQGNELKVTVGHINSLSGLQNDEKMMQFDAAIQPGNSGGPLITDDGRVVGVATATLKQEAAVATSGALAQNVNYAVKLKMAQSLTGFELIQSSQPKGSDLSPVELVESYEKSVVLIINYHDAKSPIQAERKTRSEPPMSSEGAGNSPANNDSSSNTDRAPESVKEINVQETEMKPNTQPFRPQYIYKARPQS